MICDFYPNCLAFNLAAHKRSGLQFLRTNCLASNKLATHQRVDFAKKMNPTMVEPLAAPLATWVLRLRPNPRRPMFAMGWSRALSKDFI
jgi:hypothetical protein